MGILEDYCRNPQLIDGSLEILRDLVLPTTIVTNADEDQLDTALENFNGQFDICKSSESSRSYKPRSEIFIESLRYFDLKASDVLFVGDSFTNDIIGANKLGFRTAWINPNGRVNSTSVQPDCILDSVNDLRQLIGGSSFA